MNTSSKVLAVLIFIGVLIAALLMTPLGQPIRDLFADTVSGEEAVNTVVQYETIWVNDTVYVEVPVWYNETVWVNTTEWVNMTYWVNTTSYYPFEVGWNVSTSTIYMRLYETSGGGGYQYRMDYFNQLSLSVQSTTYKSYTNYLSDLNSLKTSGALTQLQYDCALVQLFILTND